jgi:hypothetical protein
MGLELEVTLPKTASNYHKPVGTIRRGGQVARNRAEMPLCPARSEVQRVIAKRGADPDRFLGEQADLRGCPFECKLRDLPV